MNFDEISLIQILNSSNITKSRLFEILTTDLKKQRQQTSEHTQPDSENLSQLIYLLVVICLY